MLTWLSLIWSLFQFKVIIDYFWGKKHLESTMLCYSLAKHARFNFDFFVEELVEDNWGKLLGFSSVKNVDFIQSNLKSDSIFSYYWLFFGWKTYRVYAVTQPERELLSNRYGSRTTQHMHDQPKSVQLSHSTLRSTQVSWV